ncbi:MAG TPA: hypothetical protein VE842_04315 [Pyrinomonadaceae bacterium]|nr:hypothetical protein [Pyrinomonadaceae bacterium]
MTLTTTDAVPHAELNVTGKSPVALLIDLKVKVAEAALVIALELGVIVRLEVPAAVIVIALVTVTVKELVLPPILLMLILPGLTLNDGHEGPPPPFAPPTGPASTAEQSVAAMAAGAVVPLTVASEETSVVLLTLV